MILGQFRIGARQAKNAALPNLTLFQAMDMNGDGEVSVFIVFRKKAKFLRLTD